MQDVKSARVRAEVLRQEEAFILNAISHSVSVEWETTVAGSMPVHAVILPYVKEKGNEDLLNAAMCGVDYYATGKKPASVAVIPAKGRGTLSGRAISECRQVIAGGLMDLSRNARERDLQELKDYARSLMAIHSLLSVAKAQAGSNRVAGYARIGGDAITDSDQRAFDEQVKELTQQEEFLIYRMRYALLGSFGLQLDLLERKSAIQAELQLPIAGRPVNDNLCRQTSEYDNESRKVWQLTQKATDARDHWLNAHSAVKDAMDNLAEDWAIWQDDRCRETFLIYIKAKANHRRKVIERHRLYQDMQKHLNALEFAESSDMVTERLKEQQALLESELEAINEELEQSKAECMELAATLLKDEIKADRRLIVKRAASVHHRKHKASPEYKAKQREKVAKWRAAKKAQVLPNLSETITEPVESVPFQLEDMAATLRAERASLADSLGVS